MRVFIVLDKTIIMEASKKGNKSAKQVKEATWGVLVDEMLPLAESDNVRNNMGVKATDAVASKSTATSLTAQIKSLEKFAGDD
jgi:hypothetical protein